jgi:hypothetical protein
MVCSKCEAKIKTLAVPDKWKAGGAAGGAGGSSGPIRAKPTREPGALGFARSCRICKAKVHQDTYHYCQACAYKKGICAMCGTKVLDTSGYKMSSK